MAARARAAASRTYGSSMALRHAACGTRRRPPTAAEAVGLRLRPSAAGQRPQPEGGIDLPDSGSPVHRAPAVLRRPDPHAGHRPRASDRALAPCLDPSHPASLTNPAETPLEAGGRQGHSRGTPRTRHPERRFLTSGSNRLITRMAGPYRIAEVAQPLDVAADGARAAGVRRVRCRAIRAGSAGGTAESAAGPGCWSWGPACQRYRT
jgi:hypothetical protein